MTENKKPTQDLEYVTPRHQLESRDLPPKPQDVEKMLKLCKEMKGTDIEWIWKAGSRSKVFTLKAWYPKFKDREFWDYEQRDDPTWTLTDNREHGNNLIWQQKTCDCDLVLAIVDSQSQRIATQEFTVDLTHIVPLLTPIQPVFIELIAIEQAVNQGHQPIHQSLSGCAYNMVTGVLEVTTLHHSGKAWFENGIPVHATTPRTIGDMALIEMVAWQLGDTSFIHHDHPDSRTITAPLDFLINEGLSLLDKKRYLAGCNLAYESTLIRNAREPMMNVQGEDVQLKKAILDYLRKPSTLLDMLRDLELVEWQWIPAMYHMLNQNLLGIQPPMHERSMALKTLGLSKSAIGDRASHFMSPKTGLYRYETLMLFLAREFRRFKLHGCPMSLVCMQIRTGDGANVKPQWLSPQALQIVQQRVDFLKRPLDLFTHFEIMDYAILMPDTTINKASVVAANIQQALSNIVIDAQGSQLTVSCGVAGLPDHGTDLETLVKTAKGAMHQAKVLMVPLVSGLLPDVPTGVPEKRASAYVAPSEPSSTESITFESLLTQSEVIRKDDLENAIALAKQMHTPLGRVLTMDGINIPERVVRSAEEIQELVEKRELGASDAVRALALIDNSELSVDAAFRRLRIARRQDKPNILADILLQAGLIENRDLQYRLRESMSTGLPLGYLLAHQELISRAILHDAIDSIRLMRKGAISREQVLAVLQMVRKGGGTLRDFCANQQLSTEVLDTVGTGELLVNAGLMAETDVLTAREIAIVTGRDLEAVIIENGFATEDCVEKAKTLRVKIEKEKFNPAEATNILKKLSTAVASSAAPVSANKVVSATTASSQANPANRPTQAEFPRPIAPSLDQLRDRAAIKQAGEMTLPLHNQNLSKPASHEVRGAPNPTPEPPRDVDRVDLLRLAGLINDQQAEGARRLSRSIEVPPLRVLFDRGMIDELTLNLSGIAKRKIDSGELDVKKAIRVLKHCKANNVDFEAGCAAVNEQSQG